MKDTVKCPSCGHPAKWTPANTHRPFCSQRCKIIDLGGWADESHRIAGDPTLFPGVAEQPMFDE